MRNAVTGAAGEGLEGYLEALAGGTPAPGSGSAAAVTGAVAAGLLAMACRVTTRRASSPALVDAIVQADAHRRRLLALGSEDASAYETVIAARRAPARERGEALDAAMREATHVPLEVARASGHVLALAAALADEVRDSVLGELAVALELARAACAGAAVTVRLNVREVVDPRFVAATTAALAAIEASARADGDRLATRLAARMGLPPRATPG